VELARHKTMNRLAKIILKWYGPSYEPVLFGSSRYGVSDNESDLDIVILVRWRHLSSISAHSLLQDKTQPHGYGPGPKAPLPSESIFCSQIPSLTLSV
jgi:Nucleotidyltransferase domain